MKLHDVISVEEGSELKQRKMYFEGIGAYEGLLEQALALFVLHIYMYIISLIIDLIVTGKWEKT